MNLKNIKPYDAKDGSINVVIEIAQESEPVKYEFDKTTECIVVDRFNSVPMHYPCNYGFVPNTLCGDGDPIDVLVTTPYPLLPGCLIPAKPVGVLMMSDESGKDEKILAVPTVKICKDYAGINSYRDLPLSLIKKIEYFFEHYKDLEENKWVDIDAWQDQSVAIEQIKKAVNSFNSAVS